MSELPRKAEESDFTSLYITADKSSKRAQNAYLRIIGVDLVSMLIAAIAAIYNYESNYYKTNIYIISGLLLLLSLGLTVAILTMKFEDVWYQGRAMAESCKTLTWRFMVCAEPFENDLSPLAAKEVLVERIKRISAEFQDMSKSLDAKLMTKPVMTDFMLSIRNLNLFERKSYYIEYRIKDQLKWYSDKAEENKKNYYIWFITIILFQLSAIVSIGYLLMHPCSNWNFTGCFTTISASAISWLQIKRHQELKQAYTTAAQELNLIAALSEKISSENTFSQFVLESENAISREHTLWVAQRKK